MIWLPYPLPERVRVISLHEPYATLVVMGIKTLETRTWEWPYAASWLCIHAAQKIDLEACRRLNLAPLFSPCGVLRGLVWVDGPSRPLLPEDEEEACFYAPARFGWPLKHAQHFKRCVPFRGPQKFSSVDQNVVLQAMQ